MQYLHGDRCSSGKMRSTNVVLACGAESALQSWSETATCEYEAFVTSPLLCPILKDAINGDNDSNVNSSLASQLEIAAANVSVNNSSASNATNGSTQSKELPATGSQTAFTSVASLHSSNAIVKPSLELGAPMGATPRSPVQLKKASRRRRSKKK